MIHGGDTLSYESFYKGELVDFSSNINPLGTPKGLHEKLVQGFGTLTAYPDIKYRKLKASISQYLGCSIDNILVGNGAVEIIDNFIISAKRIVTTMPTFAEYSLRAIAHHKELIEISYGEDFKVNVEDIEKHIQEGDLLILGNPNNPTGLRIEKDILLDIYKIIEQRGGYLLLDEAFYEFCPYDYDSIQIFRKFGYKNVGIIRAATKFFALPGIRLGYACASIEKVNEIGKIELPWSINSLADIAGQYIFLDEEYIERSKGYIEEERGYMLENLSNIPWIRVYPTSTNYILIRLDRWDEEYIFKEFLSRGIVIRKCSSFRGLDNRHIRVAIKDRKNNTRLLNVFRELTREVGMI